MGLYDHLRLDDIDPADALRIHVEDLAVLRAEMLPRYAAALGDGPMITIDGKGHESCGSAIAAWAARMAAVHGPTVTVWRTVLDWRTALAVVRYGEAPSRPAPGGQWERQWPESWSPADVERALRWESGEDIPAAVSGRGALVPARPQLVRATLTGAEA